MTVLKKNSDLVELITVADDDEINIRDVSDTTNQATGETKRITRENFLSEIVKDQINTIVCHDGTVIVHDGSVITN